MPEQTGLRSIAKEFLSPPLLLHQLYHKVLLVVSFQLAASLCVGIKVYWCECVGSFVLHCFRAVESHGHAPKQYVEVHLSFSQLFFLILPGLVVVGPMSFSVADEISTSSDHANPLFSLSPPPGKTFSKSCYDLKIDASSFSIPAFAERTFTYLGRVSASSFSLL